MRAVPVTKIVPLLLLLCGLQLLVLPRLAAAGSLALATELFDEGQWAEARMESRRVLERAPAPAAVTADRARLLLALSTLRMAAGDQQTAQETLAALWANRATALELRCQAAYELALALPVSDKQHTCEALIFAYSHTREVELFWQAGCALYFHLLDKRALRRENAAIWHSLQTCSRAWPAPVVQAGRARVQAKRTSWTRLPARWLVALYRRQISPAIGSRCELSPSCSAYLLEASRAHGLLGFTLSADRFVREPAVYAAQEKPVIMPDGRIKYADPLSDHDFWMEKKP